MSKFEKALSSYLSSTRHCARIGTDTRSMHARRQALLRSGKIDQAAALGRVKQPSGRDAG